MFQISPDLTHHFKGFCSSPSVIMLFVYMKARFSLSYRELEEMAHIRGATLDHSTVQRWVERFAFLIDQRVRRRKRQVCKVWRMDETYIKLNGKFVYLYRAVDAFGDTVDFLLREKRDTQAAMAFFRKAFKSNTHPHKITLDKSASNKRALNILNKERSPNGQYEIHQAKYLNNRIEQDHRFIKKRTRLTLGFKSFHSAQETLSVIENIRIIQKGQIIGQKESFSAFSNFANLMA